jgi:hypothetical protein
MSLTRFRGRTVGKTAVTEIRQVTFRNRKELRMEPQRNESARSESTPEQKELPGRFQIVKLEERIAPNKGGGHIRSVAYCYDKNSK